MTSFDPRNMDTDYSRQLTAFINSMSREGSDGNGVANSRKRNRDDEHLQGELESFRVRYPMDDRAWDFLTNLPSQACARVLRDFRPRTEGDADYSSLVTTLVKRARLDCQHGATAPGLGPFEAASLGPSRELLEEFKHKFPMDERAWDFLCSASGETQERVLAEFRPRHEGDDNYSAAVTAFVRSLESRTHAKGPNQLQLDAFCERFPTDARALEYLTSSSPEVQLEVVSSFSPANMSETDYSRQLTFYVKKVRELAHSYGMPSTASGELGAPPARHAFVKRSKLSEFRERFPMDERAFDFLESLPADVQSTVLSEFKPRRAGDADYSAAVTSFIRAVRDRHASLETATGGAQGHRSGRGSESGGSESGGGTARSLLDGFRRRYPMDDRAFDFLRQASFEVQEDMLAEFRPRREGEDDYSGAVTAFIRKLQDRHGYSSGRGDDGRSKGRARSPLRNSSGSSGGELDTLQSFRERYPMDERAWDFLSNSPSNVQRLVLAEFQPRSKGDSDYSGLLTSFIRSIRGRIERWE